MKLNFLLILFLSGTSILLAQDLSELTKGGQSLPCFGAPKPTRISKSAKFSKLPIALPKYYTSVICLIPGSADNIISFFRIPENVSFLFDKNTFDPELKSANEANLSNNLAGDSVQPMILGITLPSELSSNTAADLIKDKIGKSDELGKFTSFFGGKKKNLLSIPSKKSSASANNKKSIFLNYKISDSGEDKSIQMKSEKKDNYVNYFDLKMSFKSSPNSEFQIVSFLLLSDLEVYKSDTASLLKSKKKSSGIEEEVEIALTKNILENIPKLLSEQLNIHSKVYGSQN